MAFFGEDPFDDIVREFFGKDIERSRRPYSETVYKGESEERQIDFVEDEKKIYFVFELPGYSEEDVSVSVKGTTLEVRAGKKESETESVQNYLTQKLVNGLVIKKTLPSYAKTKTIGHTMNNGVLEVVFDKKNGRK